jgi:hypothetical protein
MRRPKTNGAEIRPTWSDGAGHGRDRFGTLKRATEEEYKNLRTNTCADGRSDSLFSIDNPPFDPTPADGCGLGETERPEHEVALTSEQEEENSNQRIWFETFYTAYWRHKSKKDAERAFAKHVTTTARFEQVLSAVRSQTPEMLAREPGKRPYAASWLNGERWEDEPESAVTVAKKCSDGNGALPPPAQQILSRYIPR